MAKSVELSADPRLAGLSAENIIEVFKRASDEQLLEGLEWYADAAAIAISLANGDIGKGAGVLAALSPQKNWGENVNLAARAFKNGKASGHVGNATGKADRIMAGESWQEVLPEGVKTWHFARCIQAAGEDAWSVCVDRHAIDIALGRYGTDESRKVLDRKGGYDLVADCYRQAAAMLADAGFVGITAAQVQAVTWVVWRSEKAEAAARQAS